MYTFMHRCRHAARSVGRVPSAASWWLTSTRRVHAFRVWQLALLSVALSAGCAKQPPAPLTAPTLDPVRQLQADLTRTTQGPGVEHAAWGIAVQSLARNERLFDLNPRTLLVPASVAKLVSLSTAV